MTSPSDALALSVFHFLFLLFQNAMLNFIKILLFETNILLKVVILKIFI